jgi:hypothetical protein
MNAKALALKTADAYSADNYRSWEGACKEVLARYPDPAQAETLLRSKHMRWAADQSGAGYGCTPVTALRRYLNANEQNIANMLNPPPITVPVTIALPRQVLLHAAAALRQAADDLQKAGRTGRATDAREALAAFESYIEEKV